MDFAVLADIDGTLTPPRQPLPREMAETLNDLIVPFHVAAGSDLPLVGPQFLEPLWKFGFRKDFDAFLSNGAAQYRCLYSQGFVIEKVEELDFQQHLGNSDYRFLLETLEEILQRPEFQLPPPLEVIGERIIDRGSMLNLSPIGRPQGQLSEGAGENRRRFRSYDEETGYRLWMLAVLQQRLARLIRERQLLVMLGGETSFDLVIKGKDKTNAVRKLLERGVKRLVFVGDALFPGGNDSVISQFVQQWKGEGSCPLEAVPVEGWHHTMQVFHERHWILDRASSKRRQEMTVSDQPLISEVEKASVAHVTIDPASGEWQDLALTEEVVSAYSLQQWAQEFSLMTAGYRDRLDPEDAANPEARFNVVTVAIMAEAKARVFLRKLAPGEVGEVHIGGEVRPHTQTFIKIAARIYAAHGFKVHLRAGLSTTPIWYSSFGIVYQELQSGENFTASHSQYFKGGWKPLDSEGKQLLAEEPEIIEEVRAVVTGRQLIRLAPWQGNPLIFHDFDVDEAYVDYQRFVFGEELIAGIREEGRKGFRCSICTLGGSMKATSERLFARFGIPTGEQGVFRYFLAEEDSRYHGVGQVGGENFGVDPGSPKVYRSVGAQRILLEREADLVILWDPDGDRLKVITTAPSSLAAAARQNGLEVEEGNGERCVVYIGPNKLYLMLAAFRLDVLRKSGSLAAYDWFIGTSFPTTQSLAELAASEEIPCVRVPVGFKYIGDLCQQIETQGGGDVTFTMVTGETVRLGKKPRALILCEESGGATLGGSELLRSKSGRHTMLALREKDGLQLGLMVIALAASLYRKGSSFAAFYCDLAARKKIKFLHFIRSDVRLYDESLIGEQLEEAKAQGTLRCNWVMEFFRSLAERHAAGQISLLDVQHEINARRADDAVAMPLPTRIFSIGEGTLIETEDLRFLIRASGTDALLRYYLEGREKNTVEAVRKMLVKLKVE